MKKTVYRLRNNSPNLVKCSSWKANKDDSRVNCEKNEAICAVKRDFKTRFSEITIKNGGYERFMFGFHVFRGLDDGQPKWERHMKAPIKLRILDFTAFLSANYSLGICGMTALISTSLF